MEPDPHPEAPPSRRGASALLAIGIMAAIALVSAGAVVAWARLAAPQAAAVETGLDEELPETLADGTPFSEVPAAVAEAVEAPVVGALRLDEAPEQLSGCEDFGMPLENRRLEVAFVTGDALVVSYLGQSLEFGVEEPGPEPLPEPELGTARVACSASWDGGWVPDNVTLSSGVEEGMGVGTAVSSGCCTFDGLATATAAVGVPEDAEWLVQDRGGYRLAYPVAGLDATVLAWRYREGPFRPGPPSSAITFLDGQGEVVEETVVGF